VMKDLPVHYRGADKSLVRPGRKQARKHVRDSRDFNNIEKRAVEFFPLQGKAPKEIHTILTETLVCFLPGRAKDLAVPLYNDTHTSEYGSRTNFRNVVNIKIFQSMENVHHNSYI